MSIGSKFGLSDSLLDAVRGVTDSNNPIDTNLDVYKGLAEKKQTHMFDNEKDARAKAKEIGGKYVKGTGKSAGKHAAVAEKKKMDAVDKDELKGTHADRKDKDIDNDGDVDDSDKYLHKKRKAISKNIKNGKSNPSGKQDEVDVNPTMDDVKESAASRPQDKQAGETSAVMQGSSKTHDCAKQVTHEQWGEGTCMYAEHAEPDENGHVAWYDVMFEHGIERQVPVEEMKVITSMNHGNHKKKDK